MDQDALLSFSSDFRRHHVFEQTKATLRQRCKETSLKRFGWWGSSAAGLHSQTGFRCVHVQVCVLGQLQIVVDILDFSEACGLVGSRIAS